MSWNAAKAYRGSMRKQRRRNRRDKHGWSRVTLVLLVATLYMCMFVVPILTDQYRNLDVEKSQLVSHLGFDLFTAFAQIFCLFLGLALSPVLWFFAWTAICVFTAMSNYMVTTYHSQITKDAIAVFVEVTGREIGTFFTSDVMSALAYGLLLAVFGLALMSQQRKDPADRKKSVVALAIAGALVGINGGALATRYPPYNLLVNSVAYLKERTATAVSTRKDIYDFGATYTPPAGEKPLVVVLILGESSRADHFHINGYDRETTPLLEKRKNLVNFKDTTSCGVWTRVSVPCIVTRATAADKAPIDSETSIVSLLRHLGFETAWFAAQGNFSPADPTTAVSKEAEKRIVLEEQQYLDNTIKDEALLPLLDAMLAHRNRPMFLVLHTYGSHWQYSARYPKAFEQFKPACGMTLDRNFDIAGQVSEIGDCSKNHEALVNAYDNSILYTDYIVDQVLSRLEKYNAIAVYTGDHGESLGEGGRFLHGYEDAPENRKVAMMWWASDSFIAAHSQGWQALIQKSSSASSHDVIFHSILDCAGVVSPALIKPELSLCHATPQPVEEKHEEENHQENHDEQNQEEKPPINGSTQH